MPRMLIMGLAVTGPNAAAASDGVERIWTITRTGSGMRHLRELGRSWSSGTDPRISVGFDDFGAQSAPAVQVVHGSRANHIQRIARTDANQAESAVQSEPGQAGQSL